LGGKKLTFSATTEQKISVRAKLRIPGAKLKKKKKNPSYYFTLQITHANLSIRVSSAPAEDPSTPSMFCRHHHSHTNGDPSSYSSHTVAVVIVCFDPKIVGAVAKEI
jgi:hypothetical protein